MDARDARTLAEKLEWCYNPNIYNVYLYIAGIKFNGIFDIPESQNQ